MPMSTQVSLEIALLIEVDGGLLVRADDTAGPRFPGGSARLGESSLDAAERLLRAALSAAGRPVFAGCVEHSEAWRPAPAPSPRSSPTGATPDRTRADGTPGDTTPADRTPGDTPADRTPAETAATTDGTTSAHTLTVLYAVTLEPAGLAGGHALPPGLTLVRPYESDSGPALTIQPPAVGHAAMSWWADRWPSWRGLAVADAEPWWTGLRQSVRTLRAQLTARREDVRGEVFRDAAVAMCALVAAADGHVDPAERDAMAASIQAEDVLADYPRADLELLFDLHVARLRSDLAAGRRAAMREIGKVRGDPVRSWAVLRIGAVIGRADGYFDPAERRVVQDAADTLGLRSGALAVQAVGR
ncbi:TerB family tellurite resistance protein [Parafrankia sp. BMG5.11]|uniref:TerB family tellurite resistance protein n=2 Tax=unclassified Parafrankia TaxID=2994368 RepID=UPI000DA5982E|nr:TerB family tellurite resistance protein [Parafrankia sp. BMG5.11]TCJ34309.1 tellurium resistance protein [Parafrankia sp. BMG5.11]SQD95090.1 putative tellurium resistance protein [Parafrankia sp. Ea1.12]